MKSLPTALYNDFSGGMPFKAEMFARVYELHEINEQLDRVVQLPKQERKKWIKENADLLQDYLDDFTAHASFEFDLTHMDQELSQLMIDYTANLQELMRVVHGIFDSKKKIN